MSYELPGKFGSKNPIQKTGHALPARPGCGDGGKETLNFLEVLK
jgi:hypothetical protein